jgi:AraC-like DNA-binding protein
MSSGQLELRNWSNVRTELAWIYEGNVQPQHRDGICCPYFLGAWLILAGRARHTQGSKVVEAGRGEWLIVRQASGYQRLSDDARILSIRFTAEWPDRKPFFDDGLSTTLPADKHPALETTGRKLLEAARPHLTADPHQFRQQIMPFTDFAAIKDAFWAWFTQLHAALQGRGIAPTRTLLRDGRVMTVLQELDQIPLSTRRSEAELARLASMPVGLLVRTFRQQVGTTPKRYFDERRRAACRRLMAGSETPIKEVAIELGFQRLADFSKWFRRTEGMSPRDFRRTHNEGASPL